MFAGFLERRQDAKAASLLKDAIDCIEEQRAFAPPHQHFAKSGFREVHRRLVDHSGPVKDWTERTRGAAKSVVMKMYKEAMRLPDTTISQEATKFGALGGALLHLYIDLHALPPHKSAEARAIIEAWVEIDPEAYP